MQFDFFINMYEKILTEILTSQFQQCTAKINHDQVKFILGMQTTFKLENQLVCLQH